jgi:hypothetical protein
MLDAAGPLGCVSAFTAVHLAVAIRVNAAFSVLAVVVPLPVLSMSSMAVRWCLSLMLAMNLMRPILLMELLKLFRSRSSGRCEAERRRSG